MARRACRGEWEQGRAHRAIEPPPRSSSDLGSCFVPPLRPSAARAPSKILIPCTPFLTSSSGAAVSGAEGLGLAFGVEGDLGFAQMISHGKKVARLHRPADQRKALLRGLTTARTDSNDVVWQPERLRKWNVWKGASDVAPLSRMCGGL